MSKKNIGATLSIKDNNFTAGIRNAITGVKHVISDKQWQGIAVFIFTFVLIAAGLFCGRIVSANV